jgi:integrase/recombinase XerD
MQQTGCPSHATDDRPDEAPFADNRSRYLHHCAEHGVKATVLKVKRNDLLRIASHLDRNSREGVDMATLSRIAQERQSLHGAATASRRVIDIGRPWLRFLGWGREPIVRLSIKTNWTSTSHGCAARGFTLSTAGHWSRTIGRFLRWCEQKNHELAGLTAQDIDDYFVKGVGRSRVSVASTASALRGFLRFAASRGFCVDGLPEP